MAGFSVRKELGLLSKAERGGESPDISGVRKSSGGLEGWIVIKLNGNNYRFGESDDSMVWSSIA